MPDWTYQTIFRPILHRLPYPVAQSFAFGSMGVLGRHPVGRSIIRLMGHAKPPDDAAVKAGEFTLAVPTALGCGVDFDARAVSALSLFGFSIVEVGPLNIQNLSAGADDLSQWRTDGLAIPTASATMTPEQLRAALTRNRFRNGVCVAARINVSSASDYEAVRGLVRKLIPDVDAISIRIPITDVAGFDLSTWNELGREIQSLNCRLFVVLSADVVMRASSSLMEVLPDLAADGAMIESGIDDDGARGVLNDHAVQSAAEAVRHIRPAFKDRLLIANGGVKQPHDALRLLRAGADVVMVDSGFAEAGPGLPKRINAAARSLSCEAAESHVPAPHRSWFWSFLLGTSLLVGGVMAFVVGWTRVVLPYDEEFLGMLREEICGLNPQLLPFMSHDRVTLAGTMLALGPLYIALAWFGDRAGMAWARTAVLASAFAGFLSFFLFLGFGYFDPFHAFISAILFQLMALGLRSSQPSEKPELVDLYNGDSWKRAMWGQLLMVGHGVAIIVAGLTIGSVGVTSVFVPDDLAFMQTTRETLVAANPRLVPLVAHDRASFGGMLLSTGITVSLSALWGWQQGRRWLWWVLLSTGTIAYSTTILIHWYVGYTSLRHLVPAYAGLLVLWLAMMLSRDWILHVDSGEDAEDRPGSVNASHGCTSKWTPATQHEPSDVIDHQR